MSRQLDDRRADPRRRLRRRRTSGKRADNGEMVIAHAERHVGDGEEVLPRARRANPAAAGQRDACSPCTSTRTTSASRVSWWACCGGTELRCRSAVHVGSGASAPVPTAPAPFYERRARAVATHSAYETTSRCVRSSAAGRVEYHGGLGARRLTLPAEHFGDGPRIVRRGPPQRSSSTVNPSQSVIARA